MTKIIPKDLENVSLLLVRQEKKNRDHLPLVRRHFRSVVNLCSMLMDRNVDIYFSGVLVARKKKGEAKIVMDREYRDANRDHDFVLEVR